jgi:hypothetical protein
MTTSGIFRVQFKNDTVYLPNVYEIVAIALSSGALIIGVVLFAMMVLAIWLLLQIRNLSRNKKKYELIPSMSLLIVT